MKVAIMQPYTFPYLGYFHLIRAVDHFVFYDDVNFIKGGWINRNKILVNGEATFFTIPLEKASSNKFITDTKIKKEPKKFENILKTIELSYKNAPYFDAVFELVQTVVISDCQNLSEFAIKSITSVCAYLDLNKEFYRSSLSFPKENDLSRGGRLIDITEKLNGNFYINPIGGQSLYKKEFFEQYGIELHFIRPTPIIYQQFKNDFVPWLSIIDVLMFNSKEEINKMLDRYELI